MVSPSSSLQGWIRCGVPGIIRRGRGCKVYSPFNFCSRVSVSNLLFTQVVPGITEGPGLGAGVVRGREWGSSPLVITIVLSPELSVRDVGKAAVGDVVPTPSIVIGGGWM